MYKHKISFCIVCMNRLHQLQETLIQNMKDNADYDNLEFVLLNYNSQDGMHEWVTENFDEYIKKGKIAYYYTPEPQAFSHSHSKNLAFKLASGEILCNINADHYTGRNFANYVNEEFVKDSNIVLTTVDYFKVKKDYNPSKDVFGKVCVKKKDFISIGGFDERMNRYGFEDWDFINRLEMIGLTRVFVENTSYLQFISHSEEERYSLKTNKNNIEGIYIRYYSPAISYVLFLYKDKTFEYGTIIDKLAKNSACHKSAYLLGYPKFEFSITKSAKGNWWTESIDKSICYHIGEYTYYFSNKNNIAILEDKNLELKYWLISDEQNISNLISFDYFSYNRTIMEENLERSNVVVNPSGFGISEALGVFL